MTRVVVNDAGREYVILQCNGEFKLSSVLPNWPDFVLIRQCTLDIFALINATDPFVGKFLIPGTSGFGKLVSMIVWTFWLYYTLTNIWKTPVKAIIVGLPMDCCFLLRQKIQALGLRKVRPSPILRL
jgi:hypothetical protein